MPDHLTHVSLQSCNYYDEKFATAETNKIPGYRWFFAWQQSEKVHNPLF
jgi:hypothetical protein